MCLHNIIAQTQSQSSSMSCGLDNKEVWRNLPHFNFLFCFDGGKKFSPVTTFFPVLFSNASLASFAIFPPFLPAIAFCFTPLALLVSAIYLVDNSAKAVKINSASLIWSLKFCDLRPFKFLCCFTLSPAHSVWIMFVKKANSSDFSTPLSFQ